MKPLNSNKHIADAVGTAVKSMAVKKGHKVKSVEIEPAENGYLSTTRHDNSSDNPGYIEPTKAVHESLKGVHEHIDKVFGGKAKK